MSLPVIDFSGSAQPGKAIDHSLRGLGFMQLTHLGISEQLVLDVFAASRAFFTGPQAHKESCRYRSAEENFGYQGMLAENLDPNAPADLKETFTMRNILARPLPPERWPSPVFAQLMTQFFRETLTAAHRVQRAIALELGQQEDFFSRAHQGISCSLRLLYYPTIPATQTTQVDHTQMGAGAHTDYGFMTLLFQDPVGGLQVINHDGHWMDVPPINNAIVVNSGDLLERWTNGAYRSTVHRVKPRIGQCERLSIAMFIDPDPSTQVDVLPSCITPQNPCRYPPTTAGEHLLEKLHATHKGRYA